MQQTQTLPRRAGVGLKPLSPVRADHPTRQTKRLALHASPGRDRCQASAPQFGEYYALGHHGGVRLLVI